MLFAENNPFLELLRLNNHSLITTLKSLRGNPRGCVYTEPIWGIPFENYGRTEF